MDYRSLIDNNKRADRRSLSRKLAGSLFATKIFLISLPDIYILINLTLCVLMESSFWSDAIHLGKSIVHILVCQIIILKFFVFFI